MNLKTKIVYKTELCNYSHTYRVINFNFDVLSQLYYYKLSVYMLNGFYIYIPGKNREKIVFPNDLQKFKTNVDFNHKGIMLLVHMIYNCSYFHEQQDSLINERIVFENPQEFFNVIPWIKPEQEMISLEEFLSNNNLNYWYPKSKFDFSDLIKKEKMHSCEKEFINILLGFDIYQDCEITLSSKNGDKIIVDMIENILIKNGYDKDKLEEFSSQFYNIEEYLDNFKDFFSTELLDINYIRKSLLIIYDYDYFEDRYISDDVEKLKELYKKYSKMEKVINNIIDEISYEKSFYDIIVNRKSFKKSSYYKPEIKTKNRYAFYEIIDEKIFISATVLDIIKSNSNCSLKFQNNYYGINRNYDEYIMFINNDEKLTITEFLNKNKNFIYGTNRDYFLKDVSAVTSNNELIDNIFINMKIGFETSDFLRNYTNICNMDFFYTEDVVDIVIENGVTIVKL